MTAALFHDAGHTIGYDNHEYFGTQIAREWLPKFKYTQKQIDEICEIIMATKLPPEPKNLLQTIICDSDLDYLGRSDFIPVSNTLYEELKAQDKMSSLNTWNKIVKSCMNKSRNIISKNWLHFSTQVLVYNIIIVKSGKKIVCPWPAVRAKYNGWP